MSAFDLKLGKSVIARKLILYVVLFSTCITIIITAIQLYRDYNNDIDLINDKLHQIETVHLKTLTASLWASDREELKTHLEGISQIRDMQYLEIRDVNQIWASEGEKQDHNIIAQQYPMLYTHRGRSLDIGTLTVEASLNGVYQRLLTKFWVILISNGIKTFLVAGFIVLIFNKLVTRHVVKITEFVHRLNINQGSEQLVLDNKDKLHITNKDEIDILVDGINSMYLALEHSINAIKAQESYLSLTLHSIGDAVIATDNKGLITRINSAAEFLLACTRESVLGQPLVKIFRIVNTQSREPIISPIEQVLKFGKTVNLAENVTLLTPQHENQIFLSAAPINTEDSTNLGVILVFRDVSEAYQLQHQLYSSQQRLQSILDNAPALIYLKDTKGRYLHINQYCEKLWGISSSAIHYKTDFDIFPPKIANFTHENDEQVIRTGQVLKIEEELPHEGVNHTYLSIKAPLLDENGNPYAVCGISTDITERKQAERELEQYRNHLEELVAQRTVDLETANKELETFSYSVSHDLRSPLRGIDGFSLALLEDYEDVLDETGRDYLHRVRQGAQRMGALIDDMLTLSKNTRATLSCQDVDMSAMAKSIIDRMRERSPERKVSVKIQSGLHAFVDPVLMSVVLDNLLGNAWKYTAKRKHTIIEFGSCIHDHTPAFYVKDNGAGFNMMYARKLFNPFQRLHSADEYPGTGIGLATVARIISRHGGKIWPESEVDKGTTFFFSINTARYQVSNSSAENFKQSITHDE